MNWEFFSKRRKLSLKKFVQHAKNLSEAKEIFKNQGVEEPIDGSLDALYGSSTTKMPTIVEPTSVDKTPKKPQLPKTSVDYLEDALSSQLATEESENESVGAGKE